MPATLPRNRLYLDCPLGQGVLSLEGAQHHYLAHVLRAKVGESVALFNGVEGEWRGEITQINKRDLSLALVEQLRPQTETKDGPSLAFAPIRQNLEGLVQKATELGAVKFYPVITARTNARTNAERLRANFIEAAEQCERLDMPVLEAPQALDAFLDTCQTRIIYGDETGHGPRMSETMRNLSEGPVILLTGPEGGFTEAELARLRAQPEAYGVSLGPRILRADTAAIALLALWQAEKGDWHERPRFRG